MTCYQEITCPDCGSNHIGCAFLVWVRLKHLAAQTGRTVYQLKQGLLDDYLIQQLKNPSLKMVLAYVL
jgi:hypothetical protein